MINIKETKNFLKKSGLPILFLGLVLANIIITPNFFRVSTIWNVILQVFPTLMCAMGMTFVIATGGIDISVGATMAFSSIVFAKLLFHEESSLIFAMTMAIICAVVYGIFNGVLIALLDIQPIIVTLILSVAGRGVAQQINNGAVLSFYDDKYIKIASYRIFGEIPIQTVVLVLVIAIMIFLAKKTSFGMNFQAIGENKSASHLVGINIAATLIGVYVLCACLSGAAAVLETLRICSADPNNIGANVALDCIAAVAIGGTPMSGGKVKIMGTVVGALTMQLITTMVNMNNIQYEYSLVVKAAVIIVAIYIQLRQEGGGTGER